MDTHCPYRIFGSVLDNELKAVHFMWLGSEEPPSAVFLFSFLFKDLLLRLNILQKQLCPVSIPGIFLLLTLPIRIPSSLQGLFQEPQSFQESLLTVLVLYLFLYGFPASFVTILKWLFNRYLLNTYYLPNILIFLYFEFIHFFTNTDLSTAPAWKSICWKPKPKVMPLRGGAFGRWSPCEWDSSSYERDPTKLPGPSATGRHSRKPATVYEPGSSCQTPDLPAPWSWTMRSNRNLSAMVFYYSHPNGRRQAPSESRHWVITWSPTLTQSLPLLGASLLSGRPPGSFARAETAYDLSLCLLQQQAQPPPFTICSMRRFVESDCDTISVALRDKWNKSLLQSSTNVLLVVGFVLIWMPSSQKSIPCVYGSFVGITTEKFIRHELSPVRFSIFVRLFTIAFISYFFMSYPIKFLMLAI